MSRVGTPNETLKEIIDVLERDSSEIEDAFLEFIADRNLAEAYGSEKAATFLEECLELVNLFRESLNTSLDNTYNPALVTVLMFITSEAGFYDISTEEILSMLRLVMIAKEAELLTK